MLKPNGLIAGLVLLAALGGYAWWAQKHPAAPDTSATPAAPKILSLAADQITGIRIAKKDAVPVSLELSNGQWKIAGEKPLTADQEAVGALTTAVFPLQADRLIDDRPPSLATYGLDNPVSEVDFTTKDGKTQKVLIGLDTPSGSAAYVKLDSDAKVYTVGSAAKTAFEKSVNDLRDKRLLTLHPDKITSVTLAAAKGAPVEFSKNSGGEWQITKPKPLRADGSAVDDFVGKLKDAKMDLSAAPTPAEFAGATKVATATFVDDNGPQSLEVHKAKDGTIYAKSSVVEGIYKVAADVGTGIDKTADSFRNKKLFDFGFTDPSKVELAGKLYEKNADKWFHGSAQIDSGSIQNVVDKLRDLSASKFGDKIAGTPALTLAVTWGDKSRLDKVTINKSGDEYVGVRDGDSTAYTLDASSFNDLQKAISEIKPFTAPKADTKK